MSLSRLDTPVRLTWDFPLEHRANREVLREIARQVSSAGVFFVSLQQRPLRYRFLNDIVSELFGAQISLECGADHDEMIMVQKVSGKYQRVLLDLSGFILPDNSIDASRFAEVVKSFDNLGIEPLPFLTPLRTNLELLPDLIRLCSQHHLTGFKLPNAHIGENFKEYSPAELPRAKDLVRFRTLWHDFLNQSPTLPEMEIHDLFLWEIMTPGQQKSRSEYGGCQAANSLAHVDHRGIVHPCAAWPEPLGQLPQQSLEEIWAGPRRQSLCDHIAKTPDGCIGCTDLNTCFGGCRGLGFHLNRQNGERDLMCFGPRKGDSYSTSGPHKPGTT